VAQGWDIDAAAPRRREDRLSGRNFDGMTVDNDLHKSTAANELASIAFATLEAGFAKTRTINKGIRSASPARKIGDALSELDLRQGCGAAFDSAQPGEFDQVESLQRLRSEEMTNDAHILWFEELTRENLALVGGKNASIGELVQGLRSAGVRTPPGFATTAGVYWTFVKSNGLDRLMAGAFQRLVSTPASLAETGAAIRSAFLRGAWPDDIAQSIIDAYRDLGRRTHREEPEVAVRSVFAVKRRAMIQNSPNSSSSAASTRFR
jgi:hypothetical protein